MPDFELELNPVDFITVDTVGPKGDRVFYLQGAKGDQIITLIMEKFQSSALAESIDELLADLDERLPLSGEIPSAASIPQNMDLREPFEAEFRIGQMGLGHDQDTDLIILVAQEVVSAEDEDELAVGLAQARVVRFWVTRPMIRALAERAAEIVEKGRPDPGKNGKLINYWA